MDNEFYVYLHRRATDNKVFYVGKGKGSRAFNFNNRNAYWTNVKNKHGVIVEKVFENLSEEDALRIEKDTILELTYFGFPLTNLTSGGESPVFSEDVLRRMSLARLGKKRSRESVEKTAAANRGKKFSEERCKNISKALKGKKVPEERARRSALNKTGTKSKVADKTVYTFLHVSGQVFTGTRMELCEQFNAVKRRIRKLFYTNPRNSSDGWCVLKENETLEQARDRLKTSEKYYPEKDI